MLDAYIIEQIRKREEEKRRILERPALKLPLIPEHELPVEEEEDQETEERRVIIIDL